MYFYSPDSLQAEIRYRQDRLRREFQRPAWFQRKPKRETPAPCAPELPCPSRDVIARAPPVHSPPARPASPRAGSRRRHFRGP